MQDLSIFNNSYLIIGGPNTNKSEVSRFLSKELSIYPLFSEANYHKAVLEGISFSDGIKTYYLSKEDVLNSSAIRYLVGTSKKVVYDLKAIKIAFIKLGISSFPVAAQDERVFTSLSPNASLSGIAPMPKESSTIKKTLFIKCTSIFLVIARSVLQSAANR